MVAVASLDPLLGSPYDDPDAASFGEVPAAKELEMRAAATPAGSGALVERRHSISQILASERVGRQINGLTATTGWTVDGNVSVAAYSATNPTGYAAASSLEIQATGGTSVDRGAYLLAQNMAYLAQYGGGSLLRIHRRYTSATNLVGWRLRIYSVAEWREYQLAVAADSINTWAEVVVALGNPVATSGGTFDWSSGNNALYIWADVTGAYTGNLEVRDLRIGTTQTAKSTPDGHLVWESSYDIRARYRDDATAKASTTTAAASSAAATNIKVTSVTSMAPGDEFTIATAGFVETRTILTVGTSGAGGTGITVTEAFTFAHGSGDTVEIRYWGAWTGWLTLKVSQPPVVACDTPADAALITDPTPALAHTYSSPAAKAQASRATRIYRRLGHAYRVLGTNGRAAFWRLGDTAGTDAPDALALASGTYTAGYTLNQTGPLSPTDGTPAVLLNGSTGYITVPTQTWLHPGDTFSLVAWVKKAADGTAQTIIAAGTNDYCLRINASNQLELLKEGVGAAVLTSVVTITGTGWHLVVVTKSGGTTVLYIDGAADTGATGTPATIVASAVAIAIGRKGSTASEYLNGTIGNVAIFARALTAAEVTALYVARLETPGDQLLREDAVSGTGLTDTEPRFLLTTGLVYAWEKTAYDTDALSGTTARRAFTTTFTAPAALTNLVATPDPDTSSIQLDWDASVDGDFDHYRVYWQDEAGVYVRIDGGPVSLDDGLTALTTNQFVHKGARLGDNSYAVTQHNGALESDSIFASGSLAAAAGGGSSMWNRPDSERYTFPMRITRGSTREHQASIERFTPPGRGSTVHLTRGRTGRRASLEVRYRPVLDGDLSQLFQELQADAAGSWLKWGAGWLFDPMWVKVVEVRDSPDVGGMNTLSIECEETEP